MRRVVHLTNCRVSMFNHGKVFHKFHVITGGNEALLKALPLALFGFYIELLGLFRN